MSKETGRRTGKNKKQAKYDRDAMKFDGNNYPLVSPESIPGLQDLIGISYDKQKLEKRSKPLRRIVAKGFPRAMRFNKDEQTPPGTIGVYKTRIK